MLFVIIHVTSIRANETFLPSIDDGSLEGSIDRCSWIRTVSFCSTRRAVKNGIDPAEGSKINFFIFDVGRSVHHHTIQIN